MASYVISGASRGLGFAFLKELSSDPKNTVFGLVRDAASTKTKVASELPGRSNIHILSGDVTDFASVKAAADQTSTVTGGSLDYLIANAALQASADGFAPIGEVPTEAAADSIRKLVEVNVIGNIALYNAFLPLILKGKAKKVISLTTGMADIDFINQFDIEIGGTYATSKAALNTVNAKYSAQYKKQGVLFLSISPGVVDTGNFDPSALSQKDLENMQTMMGRFAVYAPNFRGPAPSEDAVRAVLKVAGDCSVEKGHGGAFLSQLGSKQWL